MNFSAFSLGPFVFAAPLALAALIVLPIIWWVLRATPPAPRSAQLPSLRLLDDLDPREETPDRTPWWLLVMRLLAGVLAILALAQPVHSPAGPPENQAAGPLLILLDDGWSAAPRWNELVNAADAAAGATSRDTAIHLLRTAPRPRHADPSERLSRQDLRRRLDTIEPVAWTVDRNDALERLDASGLTPARIFWASSGLTDGTDSDFAARLASRGPLTVFAAPPRGAAAITSLKSETNGVALSVRRAAAGEAIDLNVSALTLDGAALATSAVRFEAGSLETSARFDLPAPALARVSRFTLTGQRGASLVWLWDSSDRRRRVGLVSGGRSAQPLLSDVHYIRKALEPFASLVEGDIEDIVQSRPDAIILTDVGTISPTALAPLTEWVESGGALIRFAGPRLAAQSDTLLPVILRRTPRALGGALAWDEPQPLDGFVEGSPFAGLPAPTNSLVRQQILAQPAPDLQSRTWARLKDGSPVVTAAPRGAGTIILFHVTAGPDWSDLPYTGTFAQMLRRSIAAGRGEVRVDEDGAYVPQLSLDGFGRLENPPGTASPLKSAAFDTVQPSPQHPPGLYRGPAGTRAINTAAGARPALITDWPDGIERIGDAEARRLELAGPLLVGALVLVAFDLLIALAMSGRMPRLRRTASELALAGLALALLDFPADAQGLSVLQPENFSKAEAAALEMRFAYIETGDSELDARTRAGLLGLSRVLYLRTSVEPAVPHGVDPETDALELYPMIYYAMPDGDTALSDLAASRLNRYMRDGGALIVDTRTGGSFARGNNGEDVRERLAGLDLPPLAPAPPDHVLTRSFYLIDAFPGRYTDQPLWIEVPGQNGEVRGDGVSALFFGSADWAGAWAIDERARPLLSVDGGNTQREKANRFGVNLVMYILTGNYKADQVHLPALLERLGEKDTDDLRDEDFDLEDLPSSVRDGGPR